MPQQGVRVGQTLSVLRVLTTILTMAIATSANIQRHRKSFVCVLGTNRLSDPDYCVSTGGRRRQFRDHFGE
ncbi:hypothetical protein CGZ80_15455 [Rhodopirellula sp. MGV]|nr:hypothetical protein CGZ80_15455 [Rhodopirellula sp. MGV]